MSKNKNKNLNKALFKLGIKAILLAIIYLNVSALINLEQKIVTNATRDYFEIFSYSAPMVLVPNKENNKEYTYNEQVPEEVILEEMNTLAKRFNINATNWEKVLRHEATCTKDYCERGKLDNLAKNPVSTALGSAQYLIKTWEETESFKQFKKSRTDYKASLWEMALDIKSGESWRWQESLDYLGIYSI